MKSNGVTSHHVRFNEARSLVILTLGVVKLIYEKKKWHAKQKNIRRIVKEMTRKYKMERK
jgi:hypothetical protein